MKENKWTVEQSMSLPGLYIAYDEEGNSITRPTGKDRATLVASAPALRDACEFVKATLAPYRGEDACPDRAYTVSREAIKALHAALAAVKEAK